MEDLIEWRRGTSQLVTATAVSARVAIESRADALRICNVGLNTAHVRVQPGLPTATTADLAVRSNSEVVVSKALGDDSIAYLSPLGTTLHIQSGDIRPYQRVG